MIYKPRCKVCDSPLDVEMVVNSILPIVVTDITHDADNSGMYCGWGCLRAKAEEMASGD